MKIHLLAPEYGVTGQIDKSDLAALAAEGYSTVICNRPDSEVAEPDRQSPHLAAEARRLGLEFVYNPISPTGLNAANVRLQAETIDRAKSPVLAYCRSGRRATVCWMLVNAQRLPVDTIMSAAAGAGHQLDALRPQIEAMAERG